MKKEEGNGSYLDQIKRLNKILDAAIFGATRKPQKIILKMNRQGKSSAPIQTASRWLAYRGK